MTTEHPRQAQAIRTNITSTIPIPAKLVGSLPVLHHRLRRLLPRKLPHVNVTIDHPLL